MYLIIRSLAFSSRKPASSRSVPFRLGKRWAGKRLWVWQTPQEISYEIMKNWKSIISPAELIRLKKVLKKLSSSYQNTYPRLYDMKCSPGDLFMQVRLRKCEHPCSPETMVRINSINFNSSTSVSSPQKFRGKKRDWELSPTATTNKQRTKSR